MVERFVGLFSEMGFVAYFHLSPFQEHGERQNSDEANRESNEQASHLLEAPERADEEGLRAVGFMRCRNRGHQLLSERKTL